MTHISTAVLARYATGGDGLDDATVWSIEVHLETCAPCRDGMTGGLGDDSQAMLDRVFAGIDSGIAAGPPPARQSRPWSAARRRWMVGTLVPWLVMTVAVIACAVVMQSFWEGVPSLVLLLAPVAPLPGVAVAWTRRTDPAWELIAATPSAGVAMLLRRTLAVLLVVIPALALASAGSGTSPALALLPCLAFTAGTIALGAVIGVARAATVLGLAWVLGVLIPSLATVSLPAFLRPGSAGAWVLATVALVGFVAVRADSFRRQNSWR